MTRHHNSLYSWIQSAQLSVGSAAWKIARIVLGLSLFKLNKKLSPSELSALNLALLRYLDSEPLTRISGSSIFCGHSFSINKYVLDPRPETELLVKHALQYIHSIPDSVRILELGTGSGCIILSILHALKCTSQSHYAIATDISSQALKTASQNASKLDILCDFCLSDWCANISGKFNLILSNPPYVSSSSSLPKNVWAYDPPLALYASASGTRAHLAALPQALSHLSSPGMLLWEIGSDQKQWILSYIQTILPYAPKSLSVIHDSNNLPRMLKLEV